MKKNKEHRITFRMADVDYENLIRRCAEAEMSKSEYMRYLVRIPILPEEGEEGCLGKYVVVDKRAMWAMSRELTKWGYHYNQAVHALNSINYFLVHGNAKREILDQKAETVEVELQAVNENAERIVYELAQMQAASFIEEL